MLFNSFEFIFAFLPVALCGFFLIARLSRPAAAGWLTAASLFFYGWRDPRFVSLLIVSIGLNFACGTMLAARVGQPSARRVLVAGLTANLLMLGVFKYADFVIGTVNGALGAALPLTGFALPLGISFYTFTQIAFLVDAARGQAKEYRLLHYVLFVTWFPHIIAGPLLHHRGLMPQFERAEVYRWSSRHVADGLALFTMGLAKKVLLADALGPFVDPAFDGLAGGQPVTAVAAWTATLAFTFQLYFDFSGYSDMAVGLSKLFGIELPLNFNSPYQASSIADFWRRWHMTLSTFLRDYLYVPLGGNRRGEPRRYLNVAVTMVLGGLWHGANWTFVVWGGFHGLLLVGHHGWRRWRQARPEPSRPTRAGRLAGTSLTFVLVSLGWVLFRADSLTAAGRMITALVTPTSGSTLPARELLWLLGLSAFIVFGLPNSNAVIGLVQRSATETGWRGVLARTAVGPLGGAFVGGVFMTCLSRLTTVSADFFYFQF